MADTWLTEGDTAPILLSTLRDNEGNPVNIAGADIEIRIRPVRALEPQLLDVADNDQVDEGDDGSKGKVSYTFADPLPYGGYLYDWRVTFFGGEVETFPNDGPLTLAVPMDIGAGAES